MKEFKVGDKVRYIGSDSTWDADDNEIAYWMEGIVSDPNDDGEVKVSFVRRFCDNIAPEYLELVAPADPKREFLERLQGLLREFDATIDIGLNVDDEIGRCGVLIEMNNDRIFFPIVFTEMSDDPFVIAQHKYTNYPISADNIMDFDKE